MEQESPQDEVLLIKLLQPHSHTHLQSVTHYLKIKGDFKDGYLRLFCLEGLVTSWAVQVIVEFSLLSLIAVFPCGMTAMVSTQDAHRDSEILKALNVS